MTTPSEHQDLLDFLRQFNFSKAAWDGDELTCFSNLRHKDFYDGFSYPEFKPGSPTYLRMKDLEIYYRESSYKSFEVSIE